MTELEQALEQLITDYESAPASKQKTVLTNARQSLLLKLSFNPTGDDPEMPVTARDIESFKTNHSLPVPVADCLDSLEAQLNVLGRSSQQLSHEARDALETELRNLVNHFLHPSLVEKFRISDNRKFLDKGLQNCQCPWQIAMVANWVLNEKGIIKFASGAWKTHVAGVNFSELIELLIQRIRFGHIPSLRAYRRDAMHHYPRLSEDEFERLDSDQWSEVIDLPTGRPANMDIPFITPFIKQGDIEHSLYRHYLMPDLLTYMREATPEIAGKFDFILKDRNLLLGLPLAIQQIQEELFNHVKSVIASQIQQWSGNLISVSDKAESRALAIAEKIWNYKRTPAARECLSPVDNLTKGFTASILNAFAHFSDISFAASHGDQLDPFDVAEKFVLFASVSNGQLDNLALAHQHYIDQLPNPADWDNEDFFQHFLAVNRDMDPRHIQAHFIVDKTRGCPAVPQIARFHAVLLDLVLEFILSEFGEATLRDAGNWYIAAKTPPS